MGDKPFPSQGIPCISRIPCITPFLLLAWTPLFLLSLKTSFKWFCFGNLHLPTFISTSSLTHEKGPGEFLPLTARIDPENPGMDDPGFLISSRIHGPAREEMGWGGDGWRWMEMGWDIFHYFPTGITWPNSAPSKAEPVLNPVILSPSMSSLIPQEFRSFSQNAPSRG